MKIWGLQEEAYRLSKRFEGVNRAAFAREHGLKGGQAMIYQHVTGRRPISLEAAVTYARGFNCELRDISPRLASEVDRLSLSSSQSPSSSEGISKGEWPFSAPYSDYLALDEERKKRLDERVSDFLAGAAPSKPKKGKESIAQQVLSKTGLISSPEAQEKARKQKREEIAPADKKD